jgi:hypothetical protein
VALASTFASGHVNSRLNLTHLQVSKASTSKMVQDLGVSFNRWLSEHQHLDTPDALKHKVTAEPVKNLSANVFVQCMRQEGLIHVYQSLLSAKKASFTIKHFPSLSGYTWGQVRMAVPDAVVCGMVRGMTYDFFPRENLVLQV